MKDTDTDHDVKRPLWDRWLRFVDRHPRCGWYIALIVTINLLLHIIEVVH